MVLWFPLLLLACGLAALSCARLCLAAAQDTTAPAEPGTASAAPANRAFGQLTLYETAFLAGGPTRVADVALVSMARAGRLLLARTGWATVVDPVAEDDMERAVLGAIGPGGQAPVEPVRRTAAAADTVRAVADRLVAAGLAVPRGTWSDVAGAIRQVRAAAVAVPVLAAAAFLLPAQDDPETELLWWFGLPFVLALSSLAIARVEIHPYPRWASPAGRRLLGALPAHRDGLTAVAVHGTRAVVDPEVRAAFTHRSH